MVVNKQLMPVVLAVVFEHVCQAYLGQCTCKMALIVVHGTL